MSTVTGNKEVQKLLADFGKKAEQALAAALYQEGMAIMAESQREVPVDTGRLRQTGYVAPPTGPATDPSVELGYGTAYALKQHEDTTLNHPGQGKAKYLTDPMNRARGGYTDRIARRTKRNIDRGVGVTAVPANYPTKPSEGA